jgi:hypothetical protein
VLAGLQKLFSRGLCAHSHSRTLTQPNNITHHTSHNATLKNQRKRLIPEHVVGDLADWLSFVILQGSADMLASVDIGALW